MVVSTRKPAPGGPPDDRSRGRADEEVPRRTGNSLEALNGILTFAGTVFAFLGGVRDNVGWYGVAGVLGLAAVAGGVLTWRRNATRARRAAGAISFVIGLVVVLVSLWSLLHGRHTGPGKGAAPTTTSASTTPTTQQGVPTGKVTPTGGNLGANSGGNLGANSGGNQVGPTQSRTQAPTTTPTRTVPTTAVPTVTATTMTAASNASIEVTFPRDNDSLSTTADISGFATLPADHQIWLLWRHGSSGPFHVESSCRPAHDFYCEPVRLPRDGGEVFFLHALVVDPATSGTLRSGTLLPDLPRSAAHDEVMIHRQSE